MDAAAQAYNTPDWKPTWFDLFPGNMGEVPDVGSVASLIETEAATNVWEAATDPDMYGMIWNPTNPVWDDADTWMSGEVPY